MDSKVDFLYLSEPDMIKAGVKDMKACVETRGHAGSAAGRGLRHGRGES